MADAFAAMGELSGDSIFSARLARNVADILSAKVEGKTEKLAKVYLDAERDLIQRTDGVLREETIREKLAPHFASTNAEYPEFSLIFLPKEKQFLALHAGFLRLYAAHLSPLMGPRAIQKIMANAFADTHFRDVKVTLDRGLEGTGMRFQNMKECAEVAFILLEKWYEAASIVLGRKANRLAFEKAFNRLGRTYGFLPTYKDLLGVTPLGILQLEKATRLHELELETSIQAQDIRATDASLRRQTERLRQTVEELEGTKKTLEATAKARSEFIDVVAHQFRTPLSSIRWNGELLVDEFSGKEPDPTLLEAMQNIRVKSVFLIETLDRVFTTLDIDTGKISLDLKPVFFWEVIQDAATALERDFAFRGMKWKFNKKKEQLQQIPLDKARMLSVLKIVIGNGINYGAEKDTIVADLEQRKINGLEYLVVSVRDKGLGIEEKDITRIFEKFYRAPSAILKAADGTGLGLFITKHIAEAQQGMAWAESEGLGKGATFFIALPLTQPEVPQKNGAAAAQPKVIRQTIL